MFNKKKKYFKHKRNGVQKMIWDLEFKKEKSLMVREEVRREYDGTCARLQIISSRIESQKKDPTQICEIHNPEVGKEKVLLAKGTCSCQYIDNHIETGEIERLYDEKERLSLDKERYKLQMKQIDLDVYGSAKNSEFPDGADGIDQQLESLRELKIMVLSYIQKI